MIHNAMVLCAVLMGLGLRIFCRVSFLVAINQKLEYQNIGTEAKHNFQTRQYLHISLRVLHRHCARRLALSSSVHSSRSSILILTSRNSRRMMKSPAVADTWGSARDTCCVCARKVSEGWNANPASWVFICFRPIVVELGRPSSSVHSHC